MKRKEKKKVEGKRVIDMSGMGKALGFCNWERKQEE